MSDRAARHAVEDPGSDVSADELATLVRDAAAGLDERDQLVLEYSVRQALSGDDLAAALGVSLDQSYVLLHRMRERVERALGALTVARMGRKECADLAEVLKGWDGTFSVLIRKRVARHVDRCDTCADTKRRFAALSLVGAAPLLAAPGDLRDRVLSTLASSSGDRHAGEHFDAPGGFPSLPPRSHRVVLAAVVAAAVLLVTVGGITLAVRDDEPAGAQSSSTLATVVEASEGPDTSSLAPSSSSATTIASSPATVADITSTPADGSASASTAGGDSGVISTTVPSTVAVVPGPAAPPAVVEAPAGPPATTAPPLVAGTLTLSRQTIDFGGGGSTEQLVLANTGGMPLDFSVAGGGGGFSVVPASGSLGAGQNVALTVSFDRAGAAEGSHGRSLTVASSASGGGSVQLTAVVDRPPVVQVTQGLANPVCPDIAHPTVVARVVDSTTTSAVLSWSGPGGSGSAPMARSGDLWSATVTIVPTVEGSWTYTVRATDAAGQPGTASGSFVVDCPTPG